MEPTKNSNLNASTSGTNGVNNTASSQPLGPVFRGMPKPGQPLTSTPRVETPSQTPFSAHAPSALDRLMNPSLGQNSVAPSPAAQKPIAPASNPSSTTFASPISAQNSQSASSSASASGFKPYTPPSRPAMSPVSNQNSSSISSASVLASSATNASSSGYKVGTPTQYPSAQPMQNSAVSSAGTQIPNQTFGTYSSGIPAAPSASVTATKLGNEVNAILNSQQKAPKSHRGTLVLIISMIVVLLLLAGGGYYWYTNMYLPSRENVTDNSETTQESSNPQNTVNNQRSAFPTAVTKPTVVAQPVSTSTNANVKVIPPKAPTKTPSKATRVTTPFTQTQRDQVSSYIIANIGSIAPKTSGTYEVTDVTFDGPDRAVVQYTNGRNSYTAVAVASIDTAGNIRIVSFSPLEK